MSRFIPLLVLAPVALVPSVGATAEKASEETAQNGEVQAPSMVGTYRFAGGDAERKAIERAIDEAVDDMNVLIRGLARRRLRAPNMPTETLTITVEDDEIQVARSGQPMVTAPATGEPATWRNPDQGNTLEVTHRWRGERGLEQRLVGERGISVNRYALDRDGVRLTLRTIITADKLSQPLLLSATYLRVDAP